MSLLITGVGKSKKNPAKAAAKYGKNICKQVMVIQ